MLTRLLTLLQFLLTWGICWFPLCNWLTQAYATQGFPYASLLWHNCFNSYKGRFWKMLNWAALEHLVDLNIAWACFRACFPGTNMLAPAYTNAHAWTSFWSQLLHRSKSVDSICFWYLAMLIHGKKNAKFEIAFFCPTGMSQMVEIKGGVPPPTSKLSHGSKYCLCIGVEAYFYGWCNANPDFGIWSEKMVQLKSLCLVLSGL